ncbi:hypothetical protein OS493_036404, partial [Desmophyllum pertusum]
VEGLKDNLSMEIESRNDAEEEIETLKAQVASYQFHCEYICTSEPFYDIAFFDGEVTCLAYPKPPGKECCYPLLGLFCPILQLLERS